MANPTQITWTPASTNTDGSTIQPGEITGYAVGVRLASGAPGSYQGITQVPAGATSFPLAAFSPQPTLGVPLIAAVQSTGPTSSAWAESPEFTLAAPVPLVPNPPQAVSVA